VGIGLCIFQLEHQKFLATFVIIFSFRKQSSYGKKPSPQSGANINLALSI